MAVQIRAGAGRRIRREAYEKQSSARRWDPGSSHQAPSGTNNQDFFDAIAAGITIIHINTELRIAWRRAGSKLRSPRVQTKSEAVRASNKSPS